MKKILLVLTTLFFISLPIVAQTPDFQTIKTEKGMMVLNNNKVQAFAFLLAGNNPKGEQNADGSLSLVTDNGGFRLYFVKTKDFLGTQKLTDDLEILKAHQNWDITNDENAWTRKLNTPTKFEVEKFADFVKVNNLQNQLFPSKTILTFYWSYSPPDTTSKFFNQTFLIGDVIVMFSTSYEKGFDVEIIKSFFKETLQSITLLPPQKQAVTPKKKPVKKKVGKN